MIFSMLIASHSWIFRVLMFIGKDLFMASQILYGAWIETRVSHLELFRQAILGSKFQMRDQCLSLSTRRYQQTLFTGLLTQSWFNFWKLSPMSSQLLVRDLKSLYNNPRLFVGCQGAWTFFVKSSFHCISFIFISYYPILEALWLFSGAHIIVIIAR